MSSRIRVGVVGAGANTRHLHIPRLQAIDGVEVVSVCNRSHASGARVAAEFGIPQVLPTWRAVVESDDVDAVVIGTWPYLHEPVTIAALEAGKHVLCEARMARDAAEARRMLGASRAHPDLVAQIVPSPMTLKVDRTIQRLMADGLLGELLVVDARVSTGFLDRDAPLHWRQDADLSGRNIMSMGIWYEAMMRWVGTARRVSAMGRTFVPRRRDASGVMRDALVPEHIDITGELHCGAQLHLQVSAVMGLSGGSEIYLCGSDGTIRFDSETDTVWAGRRGDDALAEVEVRSEEAQSWRVEDEFVGAIRGEEEIVLTPFTVGLQYMEFTDAVSRSLTTGCVVPVEPA
jgi:predicted dehydrogenase